jgi:hypothetical protein
MAPAGGTPEVRGFADQANEEVSMAFVTTPISRNKVRIECNALAAAGGTQALDLAADADTAPLIGGALPAAGASTAQVRTHLRFTTETVGDAGFNVAVRRATVELLNIGGVPNARFSMLKNAGGDDGVIIGILERIQSPAL